MSRGTLAAVITPKGCLVRTAAVAILVTGAVGCASGPAVSPIDSTATSQSIDSTSPVTYETSAPNELALLTAGEELCPVLWDFAKGIGEIFNTASGDVSAIASGDDRRLRWHEALDEMQARDDLLAEVVGGMTDPVLLPIKADILAGIDKSKQELASLHALLDGHPEVDDESHLPRTAQLIVRVEKVIDVVKPEMKDYDNRQLIDTWRNIPSCQHSVKDVNDGTPQANG